MHHQKQPLLHPLHSHLLPCHLQVPGINYLKLFEILNYLLSKKSKDVCLFPCNCSTMTPVNPYTPVGQNGSGSEPTDYGLEPTGTPNGADNLSSNIQLLFSMASFMVAITITHFWTDWARHCSLGLQEDTSCLHTSIDSKEAESSWDVKILMAFNNIKLAIIHPFMAFSPSRKPVLSEEQHLNVANSLLKYFCS